ncbi:hypothetical protein E0H54_31485 [Rhizobium leguminosarum bv. viciae]|nr:hypothetical protein E0H54_31485 [Rhizobium leguminosarum bv. viciae]
MKARVPIMNIGASRLGTKFELVKIVILSLTNVQNIRVTLIVIKTPLDRDQDRSLVIKTRMLVMKTPNAS